MQLATTDGTIVITNEQGGGVVSSADGAVAVVFPHPRAPAGWSPMGEYAAFADIQGNGVSVI